LDLVPPTFPLVDVDVLPPPNPAISSGMNILGFESKCRRCCWVVEIKDNDDDDVKAIASLEKVK